MHKFNEKNGQKILGTSPEEINEWQIGTWKYA